MLSGIVALTSSRLRNSVDRALLGFGELGIKKFKKIAHSEFSCGIVCASLGIQAGSRYLHQLAPFSLIR